MDLIIPFLIFIATLILGIFSNIIADIIQPKLINKKSLVVIVFIFLAVVSFILLNLDVLKPKNEKKESKALGRAKEKTTPSSSERNKTFQQISPSDSQQKTSINLRVDNKKDSSSIIDIDGNKYQTFIYNNLIWLAENLKTNIGESYSYDNEQKNQSYSGKLYTWQAALAACQMLGKGWRLPTNSEFEKLVLNNGGGYCFMAGGFNSSQQIGDAKKGYFNIRNEVTVNFNLVFGGRGMKTWIRTQYVGLYETAYYWVLNDKLDNPLSYSFSEPGKAIVRENYYGVLTTVNYYNSCRCVCEKENQYLSYKN